LNKENLQIEKVKNKVPKWFNLSKSQISSQILLEYLNLYFNNKIVTRTMLKKECQSLKTFSTNFSKMIDFSEKNHAKVFEVIDDNVTLWEPVKDFILTEYKKYQIIYPDDIEDLKLVEGEKQTIVVNVYERNLEARELCIKEYGYACSVCKVKLEDIYGELGKGFIHVHHLIPIPKLKKSYKIDPIKDLRPVCPNCHAMLHKRNPPFSINELKSKIKTK